MRVFGITTQDAERCRAILASEAKVGRVALQEARGGVMCSHPMLEAIAGHEWLLGVLQDINRDNGVEVNDG